MPPFNRDIRPYQPQGYRGNVDLSNRPQVSGFAMRQAMGDDYDGGLMDHATVYGTSMNAADYGYGRDNIVNMTPIDAANGRVNQIMNYGQMEDYIGNISSAANQRGISLMDADRPENGGRGLLMYSQDLRPGQTLDDAYNEAGSYAEKTHMMQEAWDDMRNANDPEQRYMMRLNRMLRGGY